MEKILALPGTLESFHYSGFLQNGRFLDGIGF